MSVSSAAINTPQHAPEQTLPRLSRAASLPDGRLLLHVRHFPHAHNDSLLLGRRGAFTALSVAMQVQSGSSFIFILTDGTRVELPRGYNDGTIPRGEQASFGTYALRYLPHDNDSTQALAAFDITPKTAAASPTTAAPRLLAPSLS